MLFWLKPLWEKYLWSRIACWICMLHWLQQAPHHQVPSKPCFEAQHPPQTIVSHLRHVMVWRVCFTLNVSRWSLHYCRWWQCCCKTHCWQSCGWSWSTKDNTRNAMVKPLSFFARVFVVCKATLHTATSIVTNSTYGRALALGPNNLLLLGFSDSLSIRSMMKTISIKNIHDCWS
jgi:hypothetical protein